MSKPMKIGKSDLSNTKNITGVYNKNAPIGK